MKIGGGVEGTNQGRRDARADRGLAVVPAEAVCQASLVAEAGDGASGRTVSPSRQEPGT